MDEELISLLILFIIVVIIGLVVGIYGAEILSWLINYIV